MGTRKLTVGCCVYGNQKLKNEGHAMVIRAVGPCDCSVMAPSHSVRFPRFHPFFFLLYGVGLGHRGFEFRTGMYHVENCCRGAGSGAPC